jgi:signal peptidase II
MKKATPYHRILGLSAIILINIGCDQSTKKIAQTHLHFGDEMTYLGGIFKLMYAENYGAFLSIGDNLPLEIRNLVLIAFPTILLICLVFYTFFSKKISLLYAIAFSFILGGGISNVFDRMVHGKVVDFMNLSVGNVQTGIFNMADVAIMAGLFAMIFLQFCKKNPEASHILGALRDT